MAKKRYPKAKGLQKDLAAKGLRLVKGYDVAKRKRKLSTGDLNKTVNTTRGSKKRKKR